ncbi:hypothetical protein FXO38_24440 [Capsicum annuum]|nr:hypothetical protein FXO38_24440 [Capsicum annuum]
MPTEQELGITSFITLSLVDAIADLTMELIKKELAREIAIRRAVSQGHPNVEALHDQPTVKDLGASSGGVAGGVVDVGGSHPDADANAIRGGERVDAQEKINMFEITPYTGPSHTYTDPSHLYSVPSHPSLPSCSYYKCKVCKDRQDKIIEKLEAITEAAEELQSKRGVILSKKVDIYTALGNEERNELRKTTYAKKKKSSQEYTMQMFDAQHFKSMINIREWYIDKYVDEILCLMRDKQLAYSDAYDAADRIMDLNFYNNFKNRYNKLTRLAKTLARPRFDWLVSTYEWDEDMINYVRGKRPYPHDMR